MWSKLKRNKEKSMLFTKDFRQLMNSKRIIRSKYAGLAKRGL
jgi:hypothetical protein